MKKYILYIVLLMLFGFTSVYSQDLQPVKTEDVSKAALPEDPKLSPEENAMRLTAGVDNPAKIDVQLPLDPKLDPAMFPTEDDYGDAHAKPAEVELTDPKLKTGELQRETHVVVKQEVKTLSAPDQPTGKQPDNIPDYRNLPANGGSQPSGETPANIPNYREMQGSGSQPPGNIPNK